MPIPPQGLPSWATSPQDIHSHPLHRLRLPGRCGGGSGARKAGTLRTRKSGRVTQGKGPVRGFGGCEGVSSLLWAKKEINLQQGGVKMMNEKILELARLPHSRLQFYLRKKRSVAPRPQTRRDFLWYCATMAGIVKTLSLMPPAQAIGYGLGASSGIAFFLSGVQSMGGESGQRRGDSMAITLSPERTTATDLRHLFSSYVLF